MSHDDDSYIDQLRKLVGRRKLIHPVARGIIHDTEGRVLLVQRRDNFRWSLPTGGIEVGETILECLRREVKEETGLKIIAATPIAIYSGPGFSYTDVEGNEYELFAIVFRVDEWIGELKRETDETVDAGFFHFEELPDLATNQLETLEDWAAYEGNLVVK